MTSLAHPETPLGGVSPRSLTDVPCAPTRLRGRGSVLVLGLLVVATMLAVLWSASIGQFPVTVHEVVESLGRRFSGTTPLDPLTPEQVRQVQVDGSLWHIRFPRVAMGLVVGASLAVAGCLAQGLFGNPLAEPSVLGTSAGAAVGACTVVVFGWGLGQLGLWAQPLGAFVGALLATGLAYSMARSRSRTQVLTLILTGIAVNAVANAIIAFLVFIADQAAREAIVFWQLGSLNGSGWEQVWVTLPLMTFGVGAALALAGRLDLLALGEAQARHLGVRVEVVRVVCVGLLALLTATSVAFAGIIAFVGLIVPHLFRLLLGPSHRGLLPLSALGGALLICLADVAARTLIAFADLPIGMFTALFGGPVFYLLLRRFTRTRGGE